MNAPSPRTLTYDELSAEVARLKDWQNRGEYAERLAADRGADIAKLRDRLRTLRDKWIAEQLAYPPTSEGMYAAAAVRLCAAELEDAINR